MQHHRIGLFAFMAMVVLLFGCTHVLKTTDIPTLQAGSPLKSVGSKTIAFKEFNDIRGGNDPLVVMVAKPHKFMVDQPPATLVAMELRKELERNGHTCITYTPQAKADFIVEGTVYKFSVSQRPPVFIGNVGVKLTVSRAPADSKVLIKSYQGEGRAKSATYSGWRPALTQANQAMIKEISTDTELVDFLQK